jgi:hypothetical protein
MITGASEPVGSVTFDANDVKAVDNALLTINKKKS